jgi:hypothetical protein
MRRESSTVVALVGRVPGGLLAAVAESPNVSVVRVPVAERADQAQTAKSASASGQATSVEAAREAWEHGALAMREAARRRATYVVVPDDPLAGVASAWRAMWDVSAAQESSARFEEAAAGTLAAWQARQFELPDYYVVVAPAPDGATGPDLYLGPLRSARPRRVVLAATSGPAGPGHAGTAASPAIAAGLLDTLRALDHGPWWPPLDELLESARGFYAGGLAETQHAPV